MRKEPGGRLSSLRNRGRCLAHSRKHRVTAATLSEWRERFLAGGEAMLKSRENDAEDEEVKRLKSVVAGVCVDNELLREKITRLENGRPLAFWRSKP